jgi:hypothetical protein
MYIRETKISRHNVAGGSACVDIEMKMMLFITLNHLQSLSMWNEDCEQRDNFRKTYRDSIMLPRVCYAVLWSQRSD